MSDWTNESIESFSDTALDDWVDVDFGDGLPSDLDKDMPTTGDWDPIVDKWDTQPDDTGSDGGDLGSISEKDIFTFLDKILDVLPKIIQKVTDGKTPKFDDIKITVPTSKKPSEKALVKRSNTDDPEQLILAKVKAAIREQG